MTARRGRRVTALCQWRAARKTAFVDAAALTAVEARLRAIDPTARIIRTARCNVDLDPVPGLISSEPERVPEIEPDFLTEDHA